MGWFIFIGDMLVMFFMVLLVVWVSTSASKATLDYSASIPLLDDKPVTAETELQSGETLDG